MKQFSCRYILATTFLIAALALPATLADARQGGGRGDMYDHQTGMLCLTRICDFVRKNGSPYCICKKVWPGNDRRQPPQLLCSQKIDGREEAC